jgi:uncharacterized repeat protein (TIGR02543 family)
MMKKIYRDITILILSAALAALAACTNTLDLPEAETGTVHIVIKGDSAAARTLAPASTNFTSYRASFSGPASRPEIEITGGSASVSLAPGSWTITVKAFAGTNEAGRGSKTVTVLSGLPATADITLGPITEGGIQGNFSYSIAIPPVAASASLSLTPMDSTVPVGGTPIDLKTTASGIILGLDAGYYLLNIRLEQGGKYAGRTEVVHIYNGLTTAAEYVFTDDDFSIMMSIGGSVDYTGLPSSINAMVSSATVRVYLNNSPHTLLGTAAVNTSNGSWATFVSTSAAGQTVRLILTLNLNNGRSINSHIRTAPAASASELAFNPAAVSSGVWHNRSVFNGQGGDRLLWIPESTGEYVLDVEKTHDSMDPYMSLYDGITGEEIESDNDDGEGNNSHILRNDFIAGHPYLVYVRDYHNGTGDFRFKAAMMSGVSYSVSLDQTGTYPFPAAVAGYGLQTVKAVTVTNTGSQPTGTLDIGKSGTDTAAFTVSPTSLSGIAAGGSSIFTVVPVTELTVGTYIATITVSGGNGISANFNVSFTVNPVPVYTVTFDTDGGMPAPAGQTIAEGGKVTTPPPMTKANHVFGGWYKETDLITRWDFDTDTVTDNITLHAKWIPNNLVKVLMWVNEDDGTILVSDDDITISKTSSDYPRSFTAAVTDGYTGIQWYFDGFAITGSRGTMPSITINAADYTAGSYILGVWVTKNGAPYSTDFRFTVTN